MISLYISSAVSDTPASTASVTYGPASRRIVRMNSDRSSKRIKRVISIRVDPSSARTCQRSCRSADNRFTSASIRTTRSLNCSERPSAVSRALLAASSATGSNCVRASLTAPCAIAAAALAPRTVCLASSTSARRASRRPARFSFLKYSACAEVVAAIVERATDNASRSALSEASFASIVSSSTQAVSARLVAMERRAVPISIVLPSTGVASTVSALNARLAIRDSPTE